MPGGLSEADEAIFTFLLGQLKPEKPVVDRLSAADVIAKAKLTPEQRGLLADGLEFVGPLEVDRLLAALESATEDSLGLKILSALKQSPALAGLRVETLKARLAKFSPKVQHEAEAYLCDP